MNTLTVDDAGTTGTRVGAVHVAPSVDVETTMSFARHPGRKRQSCQAA
jgi:hypothetical protein